MGLPKKGDPFCLQDCLTYEELLACFCHHGSPHNVKIYLASSELVSLVNDAQWDIDRIQPSVAWFVDTDAVLFEDTISRSVERFEDVAESLNFWDFEVSPTLGVYIDIILNSAPIHTIRRAPNDNDKMVIVEPVYNKYHVLFARMAAMVNCEFKDPKERAVWWGDETPILFEVNDFDDLVTLLKQLDRGENPDRQILWFDKQKPAPVSLATTTPDHTSVVAENLVPPHDRAKQHSQAEPSANLATTTLDQTPALSTSSFMLPPDNTRAVAIRSRSPAFSEASSGSNDEVVFQGRDNNSKAGDSDR